FQFLDALAQSSYQVFVSQDFQGLHDGLIELPRHDRQDRFPAPGYGHGSRGCGQTLWKGGELVSGFGNRNVFEHDLTSILYCPFKCTFWRSQGQANTNHLTPSLAREPLSFDGQEVVEKGAAANFFKGGDIYGTGSRSTDQGAGGYGAGAQRPRGDPRPALPLP